MEKKKNKKLDIKKIIVKSLTVIITLGIVLIIIYYIFNLLGGKSKLIEDFQKWSIDNLYLASLIYLIAVPLINLIPGISSMFFITIANIMLNDQTTKGLISSFILADLGVILSSSFLFLMGRYVGKKIIDWIIGKEEFEKAQRILTIGGKACLPFVYLLPLFPDDTISFVCGTSKMSFKYNFINVILFRSIGVFAICFLGSDFFDYKNLQPIEWCSLFILFIMIAILCILIAIYYYHYLKKKEEKKLAILLKEIKIDN